MKRALLVAAALAAPALAAAQSAGTVTFSPDAFVSAAECADAAATIDLRWTVQMDSGSLATNGVYRIFAANKPPPTANTTGTIVTKANYCFTQDDTNASILAAKIGDDIPATSQAKPGVVLAQILAAVAPAACSAPADVPIYVCVHYFPLDTTGNPATDATGRSLGTLTVSVGKPDAPTAVSVTPGEKTLHVHWSAPSGGTAAKEYQAKATATVSCPSASGTPCDSGGPYFSRKGSSSPTDVTGLTNGVPYSVVVTAYSGADNPGPESTAVTGTPEPVSDFFDYYKSAKGTEEGGCATGAAGALALLGAASVLALRRRSK